MLGLSSSVMTPSIVAVRMMAMILLSAIVLAAGIVLVTSHDRELRQATVSLEAYSAVLAEQAARAVQSVDLVVEEVAREIEHEKPSDEAALVQLATGEDRYNQLRAMTSGIPQLDAVSVIADDGRLLSFSRFFPIPDVNVADRDYFQILRDNPARQTFLSSPVQNRGTGSWTIYLARRLNAPDGSFLGLVLGAVELSYFETFYEDAQMSPGASIALWRDDGVLLARFPSYDGIGTRFNRQDRFATLQPGERRDYRVSDTVDGKDRLLVITHLMGLPLIVGVTRAVPEVLEDWWSDSILIGICAALCFAAVIAIMLFMTQQIRAHDALALALRERDEAESGRREAERQLFQAQKLDAIGQIAAGVAHDFNNLLMVIRGTTEWLYGRLAGMAECESQLGMIDHAVTRGATLTRQMLASSRQQILSPAAIDLNAVLRSIRELLRSSLGGTTRLEMSLSDGLWPVNADHGQIENAILNLVINARDAMLDGGCVRIVTGNHTLGPGEQAGLLGPGDYATLTVSDTGTGMTAEIMARAFEPFFTTKERGLGSGLGLSQVSGFVRQSHGDVILHSAPGEGTAICIMLPRVAGAALATPGFKTVQHARTVRPERLRGAGCGR